MPLTTFPEWIGPNGEQHRAWKMVQSAAALNKTSPHFTSVLSLLRGAICSSYAWKSNTL